MKKLKDMLNSMSNTFNAFTHNPELSDDVVLDLMDLQMRISKLLDKLECTKGKHEVIALKVINRGFNKHDCCTMYECPHCHKIFDSWQLFSRKDNGHCPKCNKEIEGAEC